MMIIEVNTTVIPVMVKCQLVRIIIKTIIRYTVVFKVSRNQIRSKDIKIHQLESISLLMSNCKKYWISQMLLSLSPRYLLYLPMKSNIQIDFRT